MLDQHAVGRAPVADMIVSEHLVAREIEYPRERVTHDRGPQMTYVHLLGDVWRRIFDYDAMPVGRRRDAEPGVAQLGGDLISYPVIAQGEVDETGPAGLGGRDCIAAVEPGGQLSRDLARRPAQPPGERKRDVRLVIGELRGRPSPPLPRDRQRRIFLAPTLSARQPRVGGRKWLPRAGPSRSLILSAT